ncbi:DNA polymerase III subunit delta' [Paraglaciecola hydrolytica]|uniref:DNA-directed DNA polymerase n=1 Tax=Paraglaciecola hydrolytica TaxID=1799789 RepID=A0A136A0L1_9ALTE|nr:DNA polymerase III subunit delta' [Paraglaciecola hydrolytica]KXI28765.1 DNA polymerase III subunit delta' [Paraglaciecola hydrolytica]
MYPWLSATFTQLAQRKQDNKLHHALLLQGSQGIGKSDFAKQFAALLLCSKNVQGQRCGVCHACLLQDAGNHPDFHEVISEKQIGVDQIREAIKKLSGSAQLSGTKVLVIYAAHTMTESSSNALLKTLEEPTANTFLMLLTHKSERLLPTILSRCERIIMPVPDTTQTQVWLSTQWDKPVDAEFVNLYASSPLILLDELQQEHKVSYEVFKAGLQDIIQQRVNPSQLAADWQEQVEKILKWLQFWLHLQVKRQSELPEALWQLHQQAIKAVKRVRNPGVNKVLVLNQLLTDISMLKSKP